MTPDDTTPKESTEQSDRVDWVRSRSSRRTFLRATAAAGAVTGLGGVTFAQGAAIELGGVTAGWEGRAPAEIEGETNPTLTLEPGESYEVTWENVDGLPHNFAILDADGGELVRSEIISEQGATQTVEFEATEEMAEYYCEVHPQSMRGDVNVGGGDDEQDDQELGALIPEGPTVGLEQVADGPLSQPVGFAVANEEADRRYIVDQVGQVYVHGPDGLAEEPFLDVSDTIEIGTEAFGEFERPEGFDERGLLGLAFHPDYKEERRFYLRYSAPLPEDVDADELAGPSGRWSETDQYDWELTDFDHVEVLAEFEANEDGTSADPDSERVLLEMPSPQFNHNAGDLAFGPDGYLYVPMGDGGGANDDFLGHVDDWYDDNAGGNGQDTTQNLLGGLLRIDVDDRGDEGAAGDGDGNGAGDASEGNESDAGDGENENDANGGDDRPYGIPEDNPLVDDEESLDEYYAWGLRNPWRISFDGEDLYVADVGQNLFEEVNLVEAGGNYGWNVKEGTHCFSTETPSQPPENCPDATSEDVRGGEELLDPIVEYPHTFEGQAVGISVTGGHVYRGDAVSELEGRYVFGDWSVSFTEPRGRIFVATPPDEGETDEMGMADEANETVTDDATGDGNETIGGGNETADPGNETVGDNVTDDNATIGDGNETVGNGNATDDETVGGNATDGNDTDVGNETVGNGNETAADGNVTNGNETDGDAAADAPAADVDPNREGLWEIEEVMIADSENRRINRFIPAFGRDADGEVYVLASDTGTFEGNGEVFRIVPDGEGEQIEPVEPPEQPETDGNETATNETTTDNQTVTDGNETVGNGNETVGDGNETVDDGNETAGNGNETAGDGNETDGNATDA